MYIYMTQTWEEPKWVSEKSIHVEFYKVYTQNPRGNTIIQRLLQGIWLRTQSEVRANTTGLRPTKRNRRSHNDVI